MKKHLIVIFMSVMICLVLISVAASAASIPSANAGDFAVGLNTGGNSYKSLEKNRYYLISGGNVTDGTSENYNIHYNTTGNILTLQAVANHFYQRRFKTDKMMKKRNRLLKITVNF